ncbi:MAG: esterase-like activity of phytase family protein, partial [Pirellulales bacterium]
MPLIRTIAAGFALVAVLGSVWAAAGAPPAQPPYRIVQRGSVMLPQKGTDREGQEVKIAGLSGIAWLGDDHYAAIMDNSDKLLLFKLTLARDGTPEEASNLEIVTLAEHHDYEDVAICPESLQQRIAARRIKQGFPDPGPCLLVCEENTPAIRAISIADGSLLGVIPIPKVFETRRPNRGFESLDIDADGRHIWTANEEALSADGPAATAASGTVVRIAHIAIPEPGQQQREEPIQLAYAVDPPHQFLRIFTGEPLSGVAAITGLGDGRLLVLERSGCPGLPPFENRIYLVDWREATDVSGVEQGLAERTEAHIGKTLLWKDQLGINVEGLCLGPKLAGGNR